MKKMSHLERAEGDSKAADVTLEESDTFSDIDDTEVDSYLCNEKEKKFKKTIWEDIYREYIEERQQKRAAEIKNAGPPKNAAEATEQMLDRKRLSSKIAYDVLEKLFDDSENPAKHQEKSN